MPANKNKNKKRKRTAERPTTHPRNKYLDNPPDFAQLASLYPSFKPFVFFARDGRPRIDWTDFNATRELTRVLLLHDHRLNWYFYSSNLLTFYFGYLSEHTIIYYICYCSVFYFKVCTMLFVLGCQVSSFSCVCFPVLLVLSLNSILFICIPILSVLSD